MFLRVGGNTYGKTYVSFDGVRQTLDMGIDVNAINKIFLSLKKKGYISYESRRGKRGIFMVSLDEWPLPNGKGIYRLKEKREDIPAEHRKNFEEEMVSLEERKSKFLSLVSGKNTPSENDPHHTYTDTDTDKLSIDKKEPSYTRTEDFEPYDFAAAECKRIAQEIGEENIDFLLKYRREYGFPIIQEAYRKLCTQIADGNEVDNKPKYLNTIIRRLAEEYDEKKPV